VSLVLASEWVKRFAEGSKPDARTVRSWVQRKIVPGEIIGTRTYVDAERYEREKAQPAPRRISEGSCYRV
jgi:hypothetical protein